MSLVGAAAVSGVAAGFVYGMLAFSIVLLFKAKHLAEPKNQQDFDAVLPVLEEERRRWLSEALEVVHLFARELCAAGIADRLNLPLALQRALEDREFGFGRDLAQID